MDDPRHKMAFDAIGFANQILAQHVEHLKALVDGERSMHSHLHITDPTLYRRAINDKGLAAQIRLAKAALWYHAECQAVVSDLRLDDELATDQRKGA